MTQAFNLSQLANNLNSAGQLDATDGLDGLVPIANGGTNANNASSARTNLGVAISSDVMPWVAPSTAGNVLTSNGSAWTSSTPSAGGGSFVYLGSGSASNSVVDFTGFNNSTYAAFVVYYTNVRASIACRFFVGGSLITAATYQFYVNGGTMDGTNPSDSKTASNAIQYIRMSIQTTSTTANTGYKGIMTITPSNGYASCNWQNVYAVATSTGTFNQSLQGGGALVNASAVDGVRFLNITGGNLTAGDFRLYGVKAS